jgi:hypothetical protein
LALQSTTRSRTQEIKKAIVQRPIIEIEMKKRSAIRPTEASGLAVVVAALLLTACLLAGACSWRSSSERRSDAQTTLAVKFAAACAHLLPEMTSYSFEVDGPQTFSETSTPSIQLRCGTVRNGVAWLVTVHAPGEPKAAVPHSRPDRWRHWREHSRHGDAVIRTAPDGEAAKWGPNRHLFESWAAQLPSGIVITASTLELLHHSLEQPWNSQRDLARWPVTLLSLCRVDTRTILRDHNGDPSDAFGNPHFATRSVLVVDYAIRAVDFDWETADPLAAARYLHEHAFPKVEVTWDPPIATERGIRMRGTIGGSRHLFPEIGIWLEALYGFPVAI